MPYILHINGHPGVGKLTIAELLRERLGARLLDNHSVYNVALALTEFKSAIYLDTIRTIREIAYARVLELPPDVPVILTNAHFQNSDWGRESWDRAQSLADERGVPMLVVVLRCSRDELARRIQGESRRSKRKPRDLAVFQPGSDTKEPIARGDQVLQLDTTEHTADQAADDIQAWIKTLDLAGR